MRDTLRAWDAAVLLGVAALGIVPLWRASWLRPALDEQAAVVASSGDWTLYRAKAAISAWSPPGTCRCGER